MPGFRRAGGGREASAWWPLIAHVGVALGQDWVSASREGCETRATTAPASVVLVDPNRDTSRDEERPFPALDVGRGDPAASGRVRTDRLHSVLRRHRVELDP